MKKKYYILGAILIILGIGSIVIVETFKYPDNYIYNFEGYYEDFVIKDLYYYNDETTVLIKNGEATSIAMDDDIDYDEVMLLVVIDESGKINKTITIEESLTLDNDGELYGEVSSTSIQFDQFIYISMRVIEQKYMVIYDLTSYTYTIHEMDTIFSSFIINEDSIKGVVSLRDNDYYEVTYYEYSLDFDQINKATLGYKRVGSGNPSPLINNDYIITSGELYPTPSGSMLASPKVISIYNINTDSIQRIEEEKGYSITHSYINDTDLIYFVNYVDDNKSMIDIYSIDGLLIETVINDESEYPILDIDNSRYSIFYKDSDFYDNKIRLYDKVDSSEILLSFSQRTYIHDIYHFDNDVYLVVGFSETFFSELVNGNHGYYILKYSVEELNNLK